MTGVLVGYPIWWVLGIGEIVALFAAVLMGVELLRMRRVAVQRGFGAWLLFLAWVGIGLLLLQVNAPGAIPGSSSNRYITFGYRLCWYAAATVVLLYVYNMRGRLSTLRLTRAFGWLFVTVVAGGILGGIAPHLNFPSALELLLPSGLRSVQFVHDIIHPVVAQLYSVGGTANPRASAPFAYTNEWGLNFACLLPFFLASWFGPEAGWRRRVAPFVLLVALYPVVATQNRAMWVALVISGVLVAVRAAMLGHVRLVGFALSAGAVFAAVLFLTPLGATVTHRFDNGYSNSGRATLASETVKSVATKSPVVGLGTTRNVQGSIYSIAGGNTTTCDLCTPPALGTQGHLWLVVFSTGIGGLVLYLGFFLQQFFRYARIPSRTVTVGLSVIATHLSTMAFYDTIGIALLTIFAAVGLLWRESPAPADQQSSSTRAASFDGSQTLTGYARLMRANAAIVAICLALGLMGGFAFRHWRGVEHSAVTSVVVPAEPRYPVPTPPAKSLDTIAMFIDAPSVLAAASKAAGRSVGPDDPKLSVTAVANTRVLQIHFSARTSLVATRVTAAAGAALLHERGVLLLQQQQAALTSLRAVQTSIMKALSSVDGVRKQNTDFAARLIAERQHLLGRASTVDDEIAQVESTPVNAGVITQNTGVRNASDDWLVAMCTGLMIGLALGVAIAYLRDRAGTRVGRHNRTMTVNGLSVLGRLRGTGPALLEDAARGTPTAASANAQSLALLAQMGTSTFLSAGHHEPTRAAAGALECAATRRAHDDAAETSASNRVVVVAGPQTRSRDIDVLRSSIERTGAAVTGLVLVGQNTDSSRGERQSRLRWRVENTSAEGQG